MFTLFLSECFARSSGEYLPLTVRRIRSVLLSSSVFLPAMNMYLLKSVLEMRGAASVDENRMTHPEMVFEVLEKFL